MKIRIFRYFTTLLFVSIITLLNGQYLISGIVSDASTGEALIGANVAIKNTSKPYLKNLPEAL